MTMHLVGPYLTTTNYRKRKQKKFTDRELETLQLEWRRHNKHMRQIHAHSMQFDTFNEYLNYLYGRYKPKPPSREEYKPTTGYHRETPHIPSLGDGVGNGLLKERQRYTGTLIKGIATMHKSNAVPILNEQQAKDVAQMRR